MSTVHPEAPLYLLVVGPSGNQHRGGVIVSHWGYYTATGHYSTTSIIELFENSGLPRDIVMQTKLHHHSNPLYWLAFSRGKHSNCRWHPVATKSVRNDLVSNSKNSFRQHGFEDSIWLQFPIRWKKYTIPITSCHLLQDQYLSWWQGCCHASLLVPLILEYVLQRYFSRAVQKLLSWIICLFSFNTHMIFCPIHKFLAHGN